MCSQPSNTWSDDIAVRRLIESDGRQCAIIVIRQLRNSREKAAKSCALTHPRNYSFRITPISHSVKPNFQPIGICICSILFWWWRLDMQPTTSWPTLYSHIPWILCDYCIRGKFGDSTTLALLLVKERKKVTPNVSNKIKEKVPFDLISISLLSVEWSTWMKNYDESGLELADYIGLKTLRGRNRKFWEAFFP